MKPGSRQSFFSFRNDSQQFRPTSVATEFVDTDWEEEDEIISDVEDNSPRVSLQSVSVVQFVVHSRSSLTHCVRPASPVSQLSHHMMRFTHRGRVEARKDTMSSTFRNKLKDPEARICSAVRQYHPSMRMSS